MHIVVCDGVFNQYVSYWTISNLMSWEIGLDMQTQVQDTSTAIQSRNLFVAVNTYDPDGKQIGTRVVDMYHYGTRNWLQNHHWWAMHNGHTVETMVANDAEVEEYLLNAKRALAEKYQAA